MPLNIPCSPNTVDVQTNTTSSLADHSALLECVVDSLDRVVLHTDKEARAKLCIWRSGIEKCGRGTNKVSLRHEMVGLDDPLNIISVNANGNTHDHLLGSFSYSTVDSEEMGSFERFKTEAEIVKSIVSLGGKNAYKLWLGSRL